jgi:hypothetical protein
VEISRQYDILDSRLIRLCTGLDYLAHDEKRLGRGLVLPNLFSFFVHSGYLEQIVGKRKPTYLQAYRLPINIFCILLLASYIMIYN